MKNQKNTISTKKKKSFKELIFFIFLAFFLFTNPSYSQSKKNEFQWKEIPKKDWNRKLKSFAYAKIKQSLKSKISFHNGTEVNYKPCPELFPNLPGEFPCSFLEYPNPTNEESFSQMGEYEEGGRIPIYISQNPPPYYSNAVLLSPYRELEEKKEKSQSIVIQPMQLFKGEVLLIYNSFGKISHYKTGNQIVLFQWQKEDGYDTLKSLILIQVNLDLNPINLKELDFSN